MSRLLAVAANTFRETVRERVLYNLVLFAILMTVSGKFMWQLSIRQEHKIIKDLGLTSMDLFGTLIAVFVGVGLVSKEIERRSLYPLLAKPLSRAELFLGKFAGLSFTLAVNVAVMALGMYATLLATSARADPALLKAVYGIMLGLLLVVAIAMLFSSITSAAMATLWTIALVIAGRFSDVIRNMRDVAPGAPGWLTTALYWSVPNFRNFDLKDRVTYGEHVPWLALAWMTAYAAVFLAVTLGVGLAVFRSRDFQ